MDIKFFYDKCLEMRNLEIDLFWKRSLYFSILNILVFTLLFTGFFNSVFIVPITMSLLGFFSSIIWYKVNLGTKYSQAKWENKLAQLEEEISVNKNQKTEFGKLRLFSITEDLDPLGWKTFYRDTYNFRDIRKQISKIFSRKTSEDYYLILFPILFVILWLSVIIFFIEKCNKPYISRKEIYLTPLKRKMSSR